MHTTYASWCRQTAYVTRGILGNDAMLHVPTSLSGESVPHVTLVHSATAGASSACMILESDSLCIRHLTEVGPVSYWPGWLGGSIPYLDSASVRYLHAIDKHTDIIHAQHSQQSPWRNVAMQACKMHRRSRKLHHHPSPLQTPACHEMSRAVTQQCGIATKKQCGIAAKTNHASSAMLPKWHPANGS